MGRIRKGYEARFEGLLRRIGARRIKPGVDWLTAKAQDLSAKEGIPSDAALARVCQKLVDSAKLSKTTSSTEAPRFFCDAGLGGLARWLRAAGYEALWESGIEDALLLERAREHCATILTTDSLLMERRLLRDRVIPSLWLSPSLTVPEQLAQVFREFQLGLQAPRCMSCGGELKTVDKEAMHERIPPRTYRRLDEYFLCRRCGKLFWHGTHWERIQQQLKAIL
jgi:uncharacterized protein with PIN domain